MQVGGVLEHRLTHGQPPQPVLDLRRPCLAPQRHVAPPHPLRHVLGHRLVHPPRDRLLEEHRQAGLDPARLAGHDGGAAFLDPRQQPVHRLLELLDPVGEELVGHLFEADPGLGQGVQIARRVVLRGRARHRAVVGEREQGRERHRIHGVRADQPVHVHRVGVVRVLGPGRGPQRALHGGAAVTQSVPSAPREDLLEAPVGRARVGQSRPTGQIAVTKLFQLAIHSRVHARDEEARDGVDVQFQALALPALERLQVGLGHLLVRPEREQQRDVDVDALVQSLLDRPDALVRPGDLDHHIRPIDALPERADLLECALGIVRQLRRHFQRHKPVPPVRAAVHLGQDVGRELNVADRDPLVDRHRVEVLVRERAQILVVVGRAEDRLLEDRRVRRHPAQRLHRDHTGQLTALDHRPSDLIEPDADAGLGQRQQPRVQLGDRAHLYPLGANRNARASRPPARRRRPAPA